MADLSVPGAEPAHDQLPSLDAVDRVMPAALGSRVAELLADYESPEAQEPPDDGTEAADRPLSFAY